MTCFTRSSGRSVSAEEPERRKIMGKLGPKKSNKDAKTKQLQQQLEALKKKQAAKGKK